MATTILSTIITFIISGATGLLSITIRTAMETITWMITGNALLYRLMLMDRIRKTQTS